MNQQQRNRPSSHARPCAVFLRIVLFVAALTPGSASAELILNADARLTFEDNVVGVLSDRRSTSGGGMLAPGMGGSAVKQSPGDASLTLAAELGADQDSGAFTLFAKGFAEQTSYNTYSEFDSSIVGVSAGAGYYPAETVSLRFSAFGKLKAYGDSQRNAAAYGASASVKQALAKRFWAREYVQYEQNHADTPDFSYTGTTAGVEAGFALTQDTLLALGFSYLAQRYDDAASSVLRTETTSVRIDHALTKQWGAGAALDVQNSRTGSGPTATDNILSFTVRYAH